MTSKTKWLLVGPALFAGSLMIFLALLGSAWAIILAPIIGAATALWGYGWFSKLELHSFFFDWMDKDG